jgi:hypothetical protein
MPEETFKCPACGVTVEYKPEIIPAEDKAFAVPVPHW